MPIPDTVLPCSLRLSHESSVAAPTETDSRVRSCRWTRVQVYLSLKMRIMNMHNGVRAQVQSTVTPEENSPVFCSKVSIHR